MAQHDYVIDNQTAPNFRTDLNNALAAIVSTNSGTTAPTTTYADMLWYETDTNILWKRNEADSAWINLGTVDEANGKFEPNQTFATQAEAEALTNNTKPMTPLRTSQSIAAKLNAGGSAPMYACRAWVNFNGTGTVAIRASGNVTSITDNGVGDYTINFTTAMQDANYATCATQGVTVGAAQNRTINLVSATTTAVRVATFQAAAGGAADMDAVSVAIFR